MKKETVKAIVYWVATGLTAANYAFGGVIYIMRSDDVRAGMAQLGYPLYFAVMLGVWKLLGSVAIIVPRFALVKEWAYAGMFINLTGAIVSNAVMGNGISTIIGPLVGIVLIIASWALRPASRRITTSLI